MTYKIQSTERTTGIAADQETKAMLYLLNERDDSNQMHWFVIDFFNDVTGINSTCQKSWDVQSKANKNVSAKSLGKYTITLFKNFCSCLSFNYYVLFVGGVGSLVRKKEVTTDIFGINDVRETAKFALIQGLTEAAIDAEYINSSDINKTKIDNFLNELTIVICDKSKAELIKNIAQIKEKNYNDEKLNSIFNEIRDKQSVLKNNLVEGKEIEKISDFIPYKKYIFAEDINNLILNRLINYDVSRDIPLEFTTIVDKYEYDLRGDIIKQCRNSVTRVLFDKNNAKNFWVLFSAIREAINCNPLSSLDELYETIDISLVDAVPALDVNSSKYFIAIIRESMNDEN